ncbi:MAG: type II toxin-antitoxin system RelE/ParE family toxin [Clostridia bacterium]|nr:type II toxin-antitoxin system RelE/ParE family toxin [Clostridia bacterium]
MVSKVTMTRLAQSQLALHAAYVKNHHKNPQAAKAILADARQTKSTLIAVAESLDYCQDADLRRMGYCIIFFRRHRLLFIYSVHKNTVFIEATYHELQDYENTFKEEVLLM